LLELEITESCAADASRLEQVLQTLKPLGVKVSIDKLKSTARLSCR
jgi:FOG: EAL domain